MANEQTERLAQQLGEQLLAHDYFLAVAESCTGGSLSEIMTRITGSSAWFDRGFVTYSNDSKIDMLGVDEQSLTVHGAVSEEVAVEMALGTLKNSRADLTVSITGIAGPSGGTEEKPVGTVCIAWADRKGNVQSTTVHFDGDRQDVRQQSCLLAMQGLIEMLEKVS